jgi:hypothetical protein
MRLFRTIASAQGGRVFTNMAATFGVNDELMAQVVRYFLPPLIKSILRRTESAHGLLYFLEFLGSRRNDRYLADPGIFGHPQVEAEGHAILATLFPNPAHLRKIIENRSRVLPLPPYILERMLPYIAIFALGAIENKTREPLRTILQRISSGQVDARAMSNPYRALAGEIRRRRLTARGQDQDRRTGLSGMIGALFARADSQRAA